MASIHTTSGTANHSTSPSRAIGLTEDLEAAQNRRRSNDPKEQKELEHGGIVGDMEKEYEPIRGRTTMSRDLSSLNKSRSRPHSTRSGRSLVSGADFYTCSSGDEKQQQRQTPSGEGSPADPEKTFEVQWDGDNDPMNPRSMPKGKKWLIVTVVSISAICVSVTIDRVISCQHTG